MNNKYIDRIQSVYPDLIIKNYSSNKIGQNNDVIIINNSLVFRFPKYQEGIVQLKKETNILSNINNRISISIPHPIYSSFDESEPGKVFAGYKLIEGVPLSRESLNEMKSVEQVNELASQLVSFLVELHSIAAARAGQAIALQTSSPREDMYNLYHKIQATLYPFIRKDAQEEITETFSKSLESATFRNVEETLIHGDFGASNILWSQETRSITGIIDFGSSSLGDPAYDLAGILASYGENFFNLCLNLYPRGNGIAERAKFYKSTFALQEALHGIENNDKDAFQSGIKDYR